MILPFVTYAGAQKLYTDSVFRLADSILAAHVGQKIFRENFSRSPESTIEYMGLLGDVNKSSLLPGKRTSGRIVEIIVQYAFSLHDSRIIFNNTAEVRLNGNLQLLSEPELHFIPAYLIENRNSDFVSYERALSIAKSNQMREVSKPSNAYIIYDSNRRIYKWVFENYAEGSKDQGRPGQFSTEVMEINAITGDLISHTTNKFGPQN